MFLRSPLVILNFFSSRDWQSWGLEHRPLILERIPVLIDDDLRLENGPAAPRPVTPDLVGQVETTSMPERCVAAAQRARAASRRSRYGKRKPYKKRGRVRFVWPPTA